MAHDHHHASATGSGKNLRTAFWLNLGFTVLEFFGGWYTNSVAITSDALHDLGDSLSLGTAWYLDHFSKRSATRKYSYGYRRFSLLGALINSITLITGSIFVVREAVGRILEPQASDAEGMVAFALIGIAVNGYAAWRLSGGESLNERVVSWHLLEDVLGWVAVLVVAVVLLFEDVPYLDPSLSILITLYILYNVVRRLRQTLHLFLQGVPEDIKLEELQHRLLELEHVKSMHHTHLWSLEGENHVFSTHLELHHIDSFDQLLQTRRAVNEVLADYPLAHHTVELELEADSCPLLPGGTEEEKHGTYEKDT